MVPLHVGKPSTGFVNYTQVDLLADARSKIERQPIEIAIIAFGANDTQPLHGAAQPTPFMSDEWKRVLRLNGGRWGKVVESLAPYSTIVE